MIEPCCYQKQLRDFFQRMSGSSIMATNSDFILSDFLSWVLWRCPMSVLTIACKNVSDETMECISSLLNRKYYDVVSKSNVPLLNKVNIITNGGDTPLLSSCIAKHSRISHCIENHGMDVMTLSDGIKHYVFHGEFPQTRSTFAVTRTINVTDNKEVYDEITRLLESKMRVRKKRKKRNK